MLSCGMWRRVGLVRIDVSEEHIACIFGVEEAKYSSEMSVDFQRNMQRYVLQVFF
jgi:hypothetical protein